MFIFSFCIRLVTRFSDSVLGILQHYYITTRIRECLICNSRFLIQNLLIQSLSLFLAGIVKTLNLES